MNRRHKMTEWIPGNTPNELGDYWVTLKSGIVVYDEFYSVTDADNICSDPEWYWIDDRDIVAYMHIDRPAPYIPPNLK
jgi:hypothetical protein